MEAPRRRSSGCGSQHHAGSACSAELLRNASGRGRGTWVTNQVAGKEVVAEAPRIDGRAIAMEEDPRSQVHQGLRVGTRLQCWALRQLADFVVYKAAMFGIPCSPIRPDQQSLLYSNWIADEASLRPWLPGHRTSMRLNHARLGERALAPRRCW